MEKTSKEKWIDKVMDSTAGLQKAMPQDGLFHSIEEKVSNTVSYARTVPLRTVSLAAASIVLLVAVNLYMLSNDTQKSNITEQSRVETVVEYYGLNDNGINI